MSFNLKFLLIIGLTITSTFLSACGLWGESMARFSSSSNNISSGAGCMRDSLDTFDHYFSGQASQVSINGAWSCVDESIDLFSKKVRGANPGFYTSRELAGFVEGQILDPGATLSEDLLHQVMKLKVFFVGGTTDRLTLQEVSDLRNLAQQFKTLFAELQPSMKILSGNFDQTQESLDSFRNRLTQTESEFNQAIQTYWPKFNSPFDLNDLKSLSVALSENFPASQGLKTFESKIELYLPLILQIKRVTLNSSTDLISTQDWNRILEVFPSLLMRLTSYNYLLKGKTLLWDHQLTDFGIWLNQSLDSVIRILNVRGNGTAIGITTSELNQLIDKPEQADLLTSFLKAATLKSLLPVAISRFLTPLDQRFAGKLEKDLSPKVISVFRAELNDYLSIQQRLNQLTIQKATWGHIELRTTFSGATGAQAEFLRILQSPQSYAFDDKERMHIVSGQEIQYDRKGLEKLNFIRSFAHLFIRSYAKDLARAQNTTSLTKDEVLTDAFNELRPVLVQAELIEADNLRFAKNRFMEANLFTPVGNGDGSADFQETAGIALMIWSGLNLSKEIEPFIKNNCRVAGSNPEVYNVPCALDQFRQQVPLLATNIPLMGQSLLSQSPTLAAQMLLDTLKATGWAMNPGNTAKMSDLSLVPHLLQYMESIYRRWDTDHNKFLNKPEAMIAEPTFRPLLSEISGQTSTSVLRAAFAYILIYQKNPADDFLNFIFFMNDEANWNINVDRPKLSKVLGFIADQVSKP